MRVAIVQRALRAYRSGFYEALRDDLARTGIRLDLYQSTPPAELDPRDDPLDISWSQRLAVRRIPIGGQRLIWQPLVPELKRAQLVVVEQAADLALNYRLLLRQRLGKVRLAFWGHGQSFAPDANRSAEWLKAWFSRRAHWWFAYTDRSAGIVEGLGFDRDRITVVNNTIDTAALARDLEAVRGERADRLRASLSLGDGPVGLFIGTLRPDKGIDVLLDAAARIHAQREDFRLLVVGSGAMEAEIRDRAAHEPWLHYLGPRYGPERAEVLAIADLLLLPGWVGLAIIDSFVAGVPLVASRDRPHPPEIAYLRDRENGLLVADGGRGDAYADAVIELLADPALMHELREGCAQAATAYALDAMVRRFADGIRQALAPS